MNTKEKGQAGEDQAAAFLEAAGLHIIVRNVRSMYGEIDLVARDGDTIVFVEVKAWSTYGIEELRYGLSRRKRWRIIETAKYFLAMNREYSSMAVRFDVVFIRSMKPRMDQPVQPAVTHLVSAFMESV
ncbi:MAG: YraN family protein [Treponema sp.]|jgi:putative endonuclease|nr:YraN family protein [Treponema sp.]